MFRIAILSVSGLFFLSPNTLLAQNKQAPAKQVAVPNPVAGSNGRLNIPNPSVGQGAGAFGTPRAGGRTHNGIDIPAQSGTPVQAVQGGKVIRSLTPEVPPYSTRNTPPIPLNGAGNRVTIQHANGTTSSYFHLNGQNQPPVGTKVVPGQVIGNVGRSGNVPAGADTHLHFEMKQNGKPVAPVISSTPATSTPSRPTAPVTSRPSGKR